MHNTNQNIFSEKEFLNDCPDYKFIPMILPATERIIAMGDIHGDLKLAIRSFKLANLIDDNLNWIANPPNTIVVQVGDQIDSCRPIPNVYDCQKRKYPGDKAEDIDVINFFNKMNTLASKYGGAVYSLLGNHELMNSQGRFDYVSYENYYNFKYEDPNTKKIYEGPHGRQEAFKPGGPIANLMACTRPSLLIIGSTMFVHAGILPVLATNLQYLNMDPEASLRYLNLIVRKWLLNKLTEEQRRDKKIFINNLRISPFWTRIYGSIPINTGLESADCDLYVKRALEVYSIGKLVIGHTPQLFTNNDGINGTCYVKNNSGLDNKLYRIDGGFSRAFNIFNKNNNMVQVLEIINDKIFNIITDETLYKYISPPNININKNQMDKISSIYSQNRTPKRINTKHKKRNMRKLIY